MDFLSRRALFRSVAATVLLAACGPLPPTQAPPKPAEPAKSAEAPKPAAPAPAGPAPTPTLPPVFTPVPQAAGTTKILMRVHWSGGRFNDFQKIINDYNGTQGTKDKIYLTLERFIAGQAGPIATFIADFQAGTQEDIYHLNDAYLADLAARNFFVAPPQEIQGYIKQHFLASAIKTGTWQGKVMGHPTENQPHMMFLHKKLFTEAGMDAVKDAPKTYDDIRRLSKALTKKDASGQKTQAGYIEHINSGERVMVQRMLYQALEGAPLVDDTKTPPVWDVTSDGARKFTDLIYNIAQDGSGSAEMGAQNLIWQGAKGGIITHDAWAVVFQVIAAGLPNLINEQHTISLRSSDGSKAGNISRNYHFLVSSKSKNIDLSWQFLKWMNDGPEYRMQDFQTNVFGFVPSVKDYPMPKPFPDQMKAAFTQSMGESTQTAMPVVKGLAEVYNIMRDNYDALVLKKVNNKEFTERLDAELKKAMQSAYAN
ncbi:MAG: extracellular solute-binding protein [Chloroflexota bacterium]|nr:MAG: extracellular solute-binding protein [Chloroflexota bacterium]